MSCRFTCNWIEIGCWCLYPWLRNSNLIPWQQGRKRVCIDVLVSAHQGSLKTTLDCPLVIILDHMIHKIKWWQYVPVSLLIPIVKFILILLISYLLPIIILLSLKWRQFATHDQSTLRSLATLPSTLFTITSFCLFTAHIHPLQIVPM